LEARPSLKKKFHLLSNPAQTMMMMMEAQYFFKSFVFSIVRQFQNKKFTMHD